MVNIYCRAVASFAKVWLNKISEHTAMKARFIDPSMEFDEPFNSPVFISFYTNYTKEVGRLINKV